MAAICVLAASVGFLTFRKSEESSILDRCSEIEEEMGEYDGLEKIPRLLVVKGLVENLQLVRVSPHSQRGYDGAIWCYLILGTETEARRLQDVSKRMDVRQKELDDLFAMFPSNRGK